MLIFDVIIAPPPSPLLLLQLSNMVISRCLVQEFIFIYFKVNIIMPILNYMLLELDSYKIPDLS